MERDTNAGEYDDEQHKDKEDARPVLAEDLSSQSNPHRRARACRLLLDDPTVRNSRQGAATDEPVEDVPSENGEINRIC